jgi:hypothetical protein
LYADSALDRLVVAVFVDDVFAFRVHGRNPQNFPVDYNWRLLFLAMRGGASMEIQRTYGALGNLEKKKWREDIYCCLLKD